MMKIVRPAFILGLLFISINAFAADGDMIVNGKIGVGTTSPASILDVNGDIRLGNSNASCSSAIEGAARYNATSKTMEFCNGTEWLSVLRDASTKLLLHFDGNTGSTAFADSSTLAHAVAPNGTAQISGTSPKFGTGSLYLNGSGYANSAYSDDFNFGDGDFTIDLWIKRSDQVEQRFVLTNANSTGYSGFNIQLFVSNQIRFTSWGESSSDFIIQTSGVTLATDQWYHLAFVRSANTITIYVDGISVASGSFSGSMAISSNELKIGRRYDGEASANFYGYLDEIRIVRGKAIWTSNFTPPAAPY